MANLSTLLFFMQIVMYAAIIVLLVMLSILVSKLIKKYK